MNQKIYPRQGVIPPYSTRVVSRRTKKIWPHIAMAMFGLGWSLAYEDIGIRIYLAEPVAAVGLILLHWRNLPRRYPMLKGILSAYFIWIIAIVVSDLINNTEVIDTLRNLGTPILGGISLIFATAVLSHAPSASLTFLAAIAVGKGLLGEPLYGDAFSGQMISLETLNSYANFFKVRIDPFLTPAILLLSIIVGRRNMGRAAVIFLLASIVYFAFDSRSVGLVFFMSAMTLFAFRTGFRPRLNKIFFYGLMGMVLSYGVYVTYVNHTLEKNLDGHSGKQFQRMDNPYNPLELLTVGRSEWLVMPAAIAERPIFGWGSWAKDHNGRFARLRVERLGEGYKGDSLYIPAHSLIGSTWLWSGLLGLLAMLWFLRITWNMGFRLSHVKSPFLLPFASFSFYLILWHYFFSPPQHVRLTFPIALAILIVSSGQNFKRNRGGYGVRKMSGGYPG